MKILEEVNSITREKRYDETSYNPARLFPNICKVSFCFLIT